MKIVLVETHAAFDHPVLYTWPNKDSQISFHFYLNLSLFPEYIASIQTAHNVQPY